MKDIKKKFRVKFVVITVIFIALIVFTNGCGKEKPSKKIEKEKPSKKLEVMLNIGLVTWPGFGPLYVADKKGYFIENGLDVKISIIEDEAARRSAFASGQLDIAANTVDALASGAPRGVDGIIFLKTDESFGADGILANKSITSISQLKGKKVAYPKGLPSHYFLYLVLKENNLSISDIYSVYMEASDAGAAFTAGKIDAAVTWEPWLSQGASSGNILATTKDKPGLIVDVLMVNRDSLRDKSEALKSFLKAWFKGLRFMQDNHKEAVQIISKGLKLSVEDTEFLLTLVKFADLEENKRFFGIGGDINVCVDLFSTASELWFDEKIIDKKADPNLHCDGSVISQISE
jgi:NitT/TauT family transport system substrate-binding protein